MLDCEIGDASAGVELVGGGDCPGGAGIEAAGAVAAAIGLPRGGRKGQCGQDRAEEEKVTELRVDYHSVLALPADSRRRSDWLFHHRAGVHIRLLDSAGIPEGEAELLEATQDQFVVIFAKCVSGNPIPDSAGTGLVVVHGNNDHRPRSREGVLRGCAPLGIAGEPIHRPVLPSREPLEKIIAAEFCRHRRDAHYRKAEVMRLGCEPLLQCCGGLPGLIQRGPPIDLHRRLAGAPALPCGYRQ